MIGSKYYKDQYCKEVSAWNEEIETLSEIAKSQPHWIYKWLYIEIFVPTSCAQSNPLKRMCWTNRSIVEWCISGDNFWARWTVYRRSQGIFHFIACSGRFGNAFLEERITTAIFLKLDNSVTCRVDYNTEHDDETKRGTNIRYEKASTEIKSHMS